MKICELTENDRSKRLAADGLTIRAGAFLYTIRTRIPVVAAHMGIVYPETPVVEHPEFSDFHVAVRMTRRLVAPWEFCVTVSEGGVPLFPPCPRAEAQAYFEWGLNACISRNAHHFLLFHAASLEWQGRGFLFLGKTGTGKSTLAAGLALRGWRLLSDEFGMVAMDSCRLLALARPICLKNEAIRIIRERDPSVVTTVPAEERRKGLLCHMAPPAESVRRMDETAIPRALVFLNFVRGSGARMTALSRPEAMKRAIECSFNYRELGRAGFDCLARLVERCGCYEMRYGSLEGAERVLEGI